jgi:hypothetical protein
MNKRAFPSLQRGADKVGKNSRKDGSYNRKKQLPLKIVRIYLAGIINKNYNQNKTGGDQRVQGEII